VCEFERRLFHVDDRWIIDHFFLCMIRGDVFMDYYIGDCVGDI